MDGPVVREPLVRVHDAAEVDPRSGVLEQLGLARWATTTANVGGAMTSGLPSVRATDGSVWAW